VLLNRVISFSFPVSAGFKYHFTLQKSSNFVLMKYKNLHKNYMNMYRKNLHNNQRILEKLTFII